VNKATATALVRELAMAYRGLAEAGRLPSEQRSRDQRIRADDKVELAEQTIINALCIDDTFEKALPYNAPSRVLILESQAEQARTDIHHLHERLEKLEKKHNYLTTSVNTLARKEKERDAL